MIKKLRLRFTAVLMILLTLVMTIVIASIYISMYRSEVQNAERIIRLAINSHFEAFSEPPTPKAPPPDAPIPDVRFDHYNFHSLERFNDISSGWIGINLDTSGEIKNIFYSQHHFFDDTETAARESAVRLAAEKIREKGSNIGLITADKTAYRYAVRSAENGSVIILLDRTNEISTMNRLLIILVSIFIIALLILFVISLFLSRWAVTPIEDAWNRQRIFFSNASHELKTPLTVISANLDVITSNPNETVVTQKRWFNCIREEAEKMSKLINEMLYIAREEAAGRKNAVMSEFDISAAVEGACLAMEAVAFESGKTIVNDIEMNIIYNGEKESLLKVVNILIDNAVTYSSQGSEIKVSLSKNRSKIKLSVSNQGTPIPESELKYIFDRYYRTDSSRSRETGGFGLGLAIAKTIIDKHGGTITAASGENNTVFSVTLNS